jgi:PAS domain S-box-containing protein
MQMNLINKFWADISGIGITDDVGIPIAKRIKLTNRFAIISVFFTLPYVFAYSYFGFPKIALFSVLFCLLYISILLFNKLQGYTFAKLFLFMGVLVHQFVLASLFGEKSEVHVIYIALILLPIVLFDMNKQLGWILFCIISTILATLFLYYTKFSLLKGPELSDHATYILNIAYKITTVIGCFVILFSTIKVSQKTERALGENNILLEEQFESIFNTSLDALFLVDYTYRIIVKANKRAVELFEMNTESDFYNFEGMDLHKVAFTPSQHLEMKECLLSKGYYENEILYKTKNGNVFWGSLAIRVINIGGRVFQSVRVTDITPQKNIEQQINASLNEKEILLSEIHHRVKNNLAVISGLLGMQSAYVEDEKSKMLFEESRNRIHSMALIHDRLYQHETLAKINFNSYISDLVEHIKESYTKVLNEITFSITCDDIFLDIKNAIPCGLILNELISNSCKHAFKENQKGEIKIVCTKMGEKFTMMVSDNGIGYDFQKELRESQSLGLTLIQALSEQVGGKVKTTSNNGTAYYLSFEA